MGYWDATTRYLNQNRRGPTCSLCGKEMFPQDDHGRFTCFCNRGRSLDVRSGIELFTRKIPQVDTSKMTDEEKVKIPTVNRLDSEPTAAEAEVLSALLKGPEAMDDPEYIAAIKALEKERGNIK